MFSKLYTFDVTLQTRAKVVVAADTADAAYDRLFDGAWHSVTFDTDHSDNEVLKTHGDYKVEDREIV